MDICEAVYLEWMAENTLRNELCYLFFLNPETNQGVLAMPKKNTMDALKESVACVLETFNDALPLGLVWRGGHRTLALARGSKLNNMPIEQYFEMLMDFQNMKRVHAYQYHG
jgi:hypothetical protein